MGIFYYLDEEDEILMKWGVVIVECLEVVFEDFIFCDNMGMM